MRTWQLKIKVKSGFHGVDDEGWNVLIFGGDCCLSLRGRKILTINKLSQRKNCDKMWRRISTQIFAAVKRFRIRYFPNVNHDGSLNTKVPWLWIICFLVIIIITSYNTSFFTDSSLSYRHQPLHLLSSHYKVSPCSFYLFYIIYHHYSVIYFLFLYSCLPYTSEEQSVELTGCL
jgi:hypothetical protein